MLKENIKINLHRWRPCASFIGSERVNWANEGREERREEVK